MRSRESRLESVRRIVGAARALVASRATLAPAIVESTGLSPAGVELALTRHLEVNATDGELGLLVDRAGDAARVAVILSSNVFVGALRAIAVARAASPSVVVRPSRRDPAFARALVKRANDPGLVLDEDLDVAKVEGGEIHVYGRDETIREVRERAAPSVVVRGHGSGMGLAFVSPAADLDLAARGIADDVVVFDQRGCLSPRVVLVEGDLARADRVADALHAALESASHTVPRGDLPSEERAAGDRYVATMTYACRALVGKDHAIGVAPPGAPMVLPPAYRHVHVAACESAEQIEALVAALRPGLTAIGTDDFERITAWTPPGVRVSALGAMQRPPLDGPVDLRGD